MKVLHVISGLNVGGAESFISNLISVLDGEDYKFDFLIKEKNITNEVIPKKCKENNYNIFITDSCYKHPVKNYFQVKKILSEKQYDVIHIHANALIYITPIIIANRNKIRTILHSHSVINNRGGIIARLVHVMNRTIIKKIKMTNIACSKEAGKWMFGSKNFQIINNAIDSKKYQYNNETAQKLKAENNLSNEIIIGHAGRFVETKNHKFIIKIFNEYQKKNPNSKLFLLGEGPLRREIEMLCKELGIEDKVVLKGNVNNVHEYLMMFDICLFPSKYEGFGFFMIEAQAAGLPVIASLDIPKQGVITDLVFFESLNSSAQHWANRINLIMRERKERVHYAELIQASKFDIESLKKGMKKIYGSDFIVSE